MQELLSLFLTQVRSAWRFRWYAVACAWVIAVAGWVYVLMMPNVYEARARVFVDTDSVLKPLLSGLAVDTNVQNRVAMMSQVLMSRPNMERVARETDLYLRAPTQEDFARLIDRLPTLISIEGGGRDNTYTLRYSDSDPAMARRIVQTLLDTFVEDTLGVKRADTDSAQQFLQQQIREYEMRLREAEERLANFKKENVGLMPGETGDYYTRLQAGQSKLQDLRAQYRLAEQRRNELSKQLEGEEPTFGLFTEASTDSTDGRVIEYRRQLDQLLLQYTEKHPKVIALKETIANLEAQPGAESSNKRPTVNAPANPQEAAARALDINPVYQNLRIELSRTQVELAELRQQITEVEGAVGSLRSRVDTIPQIEAELTRLNRDYEVNRAQHQQLLQRLESARLSEQAEASTENIKFRVIEPVAMPVIPIGPNRGLLMSAVLILALGAGVAMAVVISQIKPVFLSRAMLKDITGLPVLGTVTFLQAHERAPFYRTQPVLVGAAFIGLLVAYSLGIALAESVSRLLR